MSVVLHLKASRNNKDHGTIKRTITIRGKEMPIGGIVHINQKLWAREHMVVLCNIDHFHEDKRHTIFNFGSL